MGFFPFYVQMDSPVAFVVYTSECLLLAPQLLEWALETFADFHIEK